MSCHMGICVRGVLNWPLREQKRALKYIFKDDGSPFRTVDELRNAFMNELAQGHETIPMGKCDSWDFKTGCPGHLETQETEVSNA